ncbi:hypothetical protein BT96DRAFT_924851 [Gymnopus androsaceus JB14]|uniref:Uncharacterized protein n=1 Tax=Gymnopus androsaceus JB14 TaxID=1447944 RepID=A0A6A4H3G2_9AGAR|nr:hypothetical protein BT96DRAFT_924851 [Gymnopus androsaceus JB14]
MPAHITAQSCRKTFPIPKSRPSRHTVKSVSSRARPINTSTCKMFLASNFQDCFYGVLTGKEGVQVQF